MIPPAIVNAGKDIFKYAKILLPNNQKNNKISVAMNDP